MPCCQYSRRGQGLGLGSRNGPRASERPSLVLVSATAAAVGTAFPSTLLRLFSGKTGLKLGHTCSTRRQEGRQMSLKGKTLFISGASRGSGLAIALRAARDGANVALIAKTAEPHPNLEGTVYTAAAQIEAAGGRALPVAGDIRDEAQVAQ